jgi:CRP-like cAMP-binding protein
MRRSRRQTGLADLWLFARCSRKELRIVEGLGTRLAVPAGRHLLVAGRHGREVVLVLGGRAQCLVAGRPVTEFGPGTFFGEVAALDGGTRTATVVALEDMEVLVLDGPELEALLTKVPTVALRMAQEMATRIRLANDLVVV